MHTERQTQRHPHVLTERLAERQTESRQIGRHRQRPETRDKIQRHNHRETDRDTERYLNIQRPRDRGIHTYVRHNADIWGDTWQT